jgi:hypothetical protein
MLRKTSTEPKWRREGQAWVQVALVLPLFVVVVLAGLGYGLALYRWARVGAVEATALAWIVKGATPCQVYNGTVNALEVAGLDNPPTMTFGYNAGPAGARPFSCSVPSVGNCANVRGAVTGQVVTVTLEYPATSPVPLPGFGSQYLIVKRATATVGIRQRVDIPTVCP